MFKSKVLTKHKSDKTDKPSCHLKCKHVHLSHIFNVEEKNKRNRKREREQSIKKKTLLLFNFIVRFLVRKLSTQQSLSPSPVLFVRIIIYDCWAYTRHILVPLRVWSRSFLCPHHSPWANTPHMRKKIEKKDASILRFKKKEREIEREETQREREREWKSHRNILLVFLFLRACTSVPSRSSAMRSKLAIGSSSLFSPFYWWYYIYYIYIYIFFFMENYIFHLVLAVFISLLSPRLSFLNYLWVCE